MAVISLPVIGVLLALLVTYKAVSTIVSRKIRAALTALDDLPLLALPRKDGRKIRGTAVICGGSIAGLLSARVCADHFENVTIIESEEWLATAEGLEDHHREESTEDRKVHKRSHVAQYSAIHVYQPFTTIALRKLFADFDLEVQKAGALFRPSDLKAHWSGYPVIAPWHQYAKEKFPTTMYLSRPGYETMLRRLVMRTCPNIKYVAGTVTGLLPSDFSGGAIAAVRMRPPGGKETTVPATLVIDCTGPALGGVRWLQDLASAPKDKKSAPFEILKKSYNPKMGYTTCEFDVPPRLFARLDALGYEGDYETSGFQFANFPDPTKDNRNLIIGRREFNTLQVSCGGWDVPDKMTSISEMKNFISQMVPARPIPSWIEPMLDILEEEEVPATYSYTRSPPSVYVQYHQTEGLPPNFIAVGDSVLQLNPVHGHGCTKACVEAVTLNALLAQAKLAPSEHDTGDSLPNDFGRNFFSLQSKRTCEAWAAYKTDDYAWKSTTPAKGEDHSAGAWRRAYGSEVRLLALKDRDVSSVWWHTFNYLAPTTDVISPTIVRQVAWNRLKRAVGL